MTILGLGRISGPKPMSADERRARELHPLAFKGERAPVNGLDAEWRDVARREQAAEQEDARAFAPQSDPGDETPDARALAEAEAQFERAFGEPVYADRKGYTTYTSYRSGWGKGDEMEAAYADDTRDTLTDDGPAEDKRIERGDVVQLITGGPAMLVLQIIRNDVLCIWFDADDRLNDQWLPAEALDHA
jgi:uncharacterized protein YodC (DUF2158 family)